MSKLLINQYYNQLDKVKQYGGSYNETSIRNSFFNLLNEYAHKKNLELIPELTTNGTKGKKVRPDGVLKNALRLEYGLWESKDEKTSLDDEIESKIRLGYSLKNILFEDSQTAVLYQNDFEVLRVNMKEADKLDQILNEFVNFEKPEVKEFNAALEHFKQDIPTIINTLRTKIEEANKDNKKYIVARDIFLELCQKEINPEITGDDIREMIIQHILTADIFNVVFDEPHFHRENNIARELEKLIETFFTGAARRNALESINHYYKAINAAAASIADHHEKQKFLKVIYESFYKVYNPKAADRLGVVYTPNEIVTFMLESTNYLLDKHFGRTLSDKNVEILDPATGTGTFITELIDQFIPKKDLAYKYQNEIHCNEVSILPYYIANLNIEYTFKQKMGYYEEFKNICFVDTLDNTDGLHYKGKQHDLFGLSSENTERIRRQNSKKISVIIGNPPYNANQQNENENNKNREYPAIDARIKDTYIKHSTAQKTKVYDMYSRFYRWSMDRVDNNGVIAFITNRSFIDSRTFDGFRKSIQDNFSNCYIIDTKSDVRANPKISGTGHNVFGIQTGVAIMFLVKKEKQESNCKIEYFTMEDEWRRKEKTDWFKSNKLQTVSFSHIVPDKNNNWINLSNNDWEDLLDFSKIFETVSPGVNTARDEWIFDTDQSSLSDKIEYLIKKYNSLLTKGDTTFPDLLKWSAGLKGHFLSRKRIKNYDSSLVLKFHYRPFYKTFFYSDKMLSDRLTSNHYSFLGPTLKNTNKFMLLNASAGGQKPFSVYCTEILAPFQFFVDPTQCAPFFVYNESNGKSDNLTDWGLKQFTDHYKDKKIKKENIFSYTYAVLHNPAYRKKYELNLKREFPRLPFYKDFWQWAKWGEELMDLHINYETVKPFALKSFEIKGFEAKANQKKMFAEAAEPEAMFGRKAKFKIKLKADKVTGEIELDEVTTLRGIPKEAWEYKLGNRSALEWILDQYKEKKYSDPTIAEKFNIYRFADYKDHVIDLLKRVTTVSIKTVEITTQMAIAEPHT